MSIKQANKNQWKTTTTEFRLLMSQILQQGLESFHQARNCDNEVFAEGKRNME